MIDKKAKPIEQQNVLMTISFLIVGLMMTCFAFILGKFIQTLYPGWKLTIFPALAFVVTLEALVLRHIRNSSYDSFQNPILTILVELILIILMLKLVTMLASNFSLIWLEITSWQKSFLQNFFDIDYFFLVLAILFIWMIACLFSQYLNRFEEDEDALTQEKLGYTYKDRQEERRGLISLIFIIGFAMIAFMVLMKSNLELLPDTTTPTRTLIIILLLYFFASFVFLALNQYAIMKARWFFDDITVHPSLARRWLFYSFGFILLVILLIVFLPTNFTLGFYPIAQAILEIILFIFGIIQFLFTLPIAIVVSLVNSLFSTATFEEQIQQKVPKYVPSSLEISSNMPWWDVVKSTLFWLIFLGIIVFSIRYYLRNRKAFKSFLEKVNIGKWLQDAWRWLREGFHKMRQVTVNTVQQGLQNIQTFFRNSKIKIPSLADIAQKLPPRQAVILTYVDWIKWSHSHGIKRRRSQTPIEFAKIYRKCFPEARGEIDSLTNIFMRARYTRQTINKTQAQAAHESLSSLKEIFRARQRYEETE